MTITIELSKDSMIHGGKYTTEISDEDRELAKYRWIYSNGYALGQMGGGKLKQLHRIILEFVLERPLKKGELVDHINRDKLDNRRENLRLATAQLNQINKESTGKSGFRGVSINTRRKIPTFTAVLNLENTTIGLGTFKTPEEAHIVWYRAAYAVYGDFAPLDERAVLWAKERSIRIIDIKL